MHPADRTGCLRAALALCALLAGPRALAAEPPAAAVEPRLLLGLQPSITVEPYYPEGVFDVNAAPLCAEWRAGRRVSLRASPLVTLRFGVPGAPRLAHLGAEASLPIYLDEPVPGDPPSGFWAGPATALTRNVLDLHWTTGLHADFGYALRPSRRLALLFAGQLGGTLFLHDDGSRELKEHLGVKVAVGWWL